jgi:two-component system sensor histidine kinase PilS (NtrC family)
MAGVEELEFLMVSVGVLALLLAVYFSITVLFRLRKKRSKGGTSEVGFVVDTFHEMVAALKEKERELEVLRSQAEEKAGIIEDYNENILQSVPSGVVSLDGSRRIVKLNSSAERILGIQAPDVIGKDCEEVLKDLPLQSGPGVQTRHVTASGKSLWLACTNTPLLDAGKNVIGQLLVFTDITELKALEAQAELRKRLSSLGEMAAGIAHELRNPMGVIAGYMRILSGKVDPESSGTVEAVKKEVAAMDRIVSDFLSFAKPPGLNLSDVGLLDLVGECVEGVIGEEVDAVRVSLDIDGALSLKADEVLLRQAFTNLLRNSIEALKSGGEIFVSARSEGDHLDITFSDTGHGIPEGIRVKIFLPFYSTKEQGTGLGLAVVHSIIASHGGSIEAKGGKEGATFRIRLPSRPRSGVA